MGGRREGGKGKKEMEGRGIRERSGERGKIALQVP